MYTEQEREEIFNYIVNKFKERTEVQAIIQVGSGSIGYKDKYSDIDFNIVVDETKIEEVFKKTQQDVSEKYNIVFSDNMSERRLQLFLLDNYLEIDIGYTTLKTISAVRENYKIIYDKTNQIEQIMKQTWEENKEKNKGTTKNVNMQEIITFIDGELWYNTIHAVIAFKRNNIYNCYYELDQIRNYVIDLIAKRNNKDSGRYKRIIDLEKNELEKINRLFTYITTYEELKNFLFLALKIIFEEFEYWKNKENISYEGNIDFYKNFIIENEKTNEYKKNR